MLVVTDASPLIFLSRIGLLDVLPALYDRVFVPEVVFAEVAAGGEDAPGGRAIRDAHWLEVSARTGDSSIEEAIREELDAGEAVAICLARALGADLLLIDERQGRRVARRMGLSVKGTLGILVAARRHELVEQLGPLLDQLIEMGAWLSEELVRATLAAVGEPFDQAR